MNKESVILELTSVKVASDSTYCTPFCKTETKAPGGTTEPFILDWSMWLSMPKVKAECWKPDDQMKDYRNSVNLTTVNLVAVRVQHIVIFYLILEDIDKLGN